MLTLLISLTTLAACGGGGNGPATPAAAPVALPAASPVRLAAPDASGLPAASPVLLPAGQAALRQQARRSETVASPMVTSIVIENSGAIEQGGAPLTFGQVFKPGDVASGDTLTGELDDGIRLPLQVDAKARHPDGSLRHAVISLLAPPLPPGEQRSIGLARISVGRAAYLAAPEGPATPAALLERGFGAAVRITLGGQVYSASADALLRAGQYSTWLSGPLLSEWHVAAPLTGADGVAHPHLSARFAIRAVHGEARARVDVTLENAWAFEAAPQNFTYDAEVSVGPAVVYAKTALTHYHHARWRKLFWWGAAPQVHVRHDPGYLIASRAVPNYDRTLAIGETELNALKSAWNGARTEPMGSGLAHPYMPTTGGRGDIGILPGWAVTYLLTQDRRAKEVTLGTADMAGSWPAHYRNKASGRPVSLFEFPYMTIYGLRTDTLNPATRKQEAFPQCATGASCATTPTALDTSHQPGFSYLPYLVTGDYYYLEELQFYAMWNSFQSNPGYRDKIKGLFKSDQVRGQGWSLRTVAEAAYITPDADPFKVQFAFFLKSNLDWYNANYSANPAANRLGAITNGYAVTYNNGTGLAPWMDDFFTSAVGHAAELGAEEAKPLLQYKVGFPIARMSAANACWITGASYTLKVRDSASAPFYATLGGAWRASNPAELAALPCAGTEMAAALKLKVGEMTGYSYSSTGFPANMQPALAYAADAGGAAGAAAWATFQARAVKPDYQRGPQFAVLPRP